MCVNYTKNVDPLEVYKYIEYHRDRVKYFDALYPSENIRLTNSVLTVRQKDALSILDAGIDLAIDMCQPFEGELEITEVFK